MTNKNSLLDSVLKELDSRKGSWAHISRALRKSEWKSHYSWLTKLAQRKIPDPGVKGVQELHDWMRSNPR